MIFRGFREVFFVEKALQNFENHIVLLKDPVGPNEELWLVIDPVGGVPLEVLDMNFIINLF